MLAYNELPVIVVSAMDTATAASFISELIDDEVKDVEVDNEDTADRVWRVNNKYYTAEVRLRPVGDGDGDGCGAAAAGRVDAHVVHLAAGEGEREARRRWAAVGGAPAVAVAAGEWARAPPALERWAAARRVDAVPLLERPSPVAGAPVAGAPFAEAYGVQRVRDALHAHAWRGLRRHRPRARAHAHAQPGAGECVEEAEAEGEEEAEAGAVERAEAFALALGALGGARDSPADDAQRRARAEQLVAAFARALGLDADEC